MALVKNITVDSIQAYYRTPEDYGAVGDGTTDDTAAMRAALTACATGDIRWLRGLQGKTYLTAQLEIPLGVKKISNLNMKLTTSQGVGLYSQGAANAHTDLEISDCSINGNATLRGGILLGNATRCKILRNRVYGLTADGTERYGIRLGTTVTSIINSYNVIDGNHIEMPTDPDGGTGTIGIAGIYLVGNNNLDSTSGAINWSAQYNTIQYLQVTNNVCTGGTHNVQAFGLFNAEFSGNTLIGGTHRNINLGSGCQRIKINDNRLINAESAAIIFGESRYIQISDNFIQSATTASYESDDAAIQFAQGAYSIDIVGNQILGSWLYGVHLFNSSDVNIRANSFTASRAGVAIESSQTLTPAADAIYSQRRAVMQRISSTTTRIALSGNTYSVASTGACIYLCQLNSVALSSVSITNESVALGSTPKHILYLSNANNLISNCTIDGISAVGASGTKYYSTQGRTPFYRVANADGLEDVRREVSVSAGTPSAFLGPNIFLESGDTSNFVGGIDGQILQVRMLSGATLTYNSAAMRLRGETNLASTSANTIVTLQRRLGIWFELGRNVA